MHTRHPSIYAAAGALALTLAMSSAALAQGDRGHPPAKAPPARPPAGAGHIPAHGPTRAPVPTHPVPEPGKRVAEKPGHPVAPHVDAANDRWVGHDLGPKDPNLHLDHPCGAWTLWRADRCAAHLAAEWRHARTIWV